MSDVPDRRKLKPLTEAEKRILLAAARDPASREQVVELAKVLRQAADQSHEHVAWVRGQLASAEQATQLAEEKADFMEQALREQRA